MAANSKFAQLLKEYRKSRGYTQQQLAERCQRFGLDISASMISHLEKGRREPSSAEMVMAIGKALNLPETKQIELLIDASFDVLLEAPTEALPSWLARLAIHLYDSEFLDPLMDPSSFPDSVLVGESLDSLLRIWREQYLLRRQLRRRKWQDVLDSVAQVEGSLEKLTAQVMAYLKDVETLAQQHLGKPSLAERAARQAGSHAAQGGDLNIAATSAVHMADLLKNSAYMMEARNEYEKAERWFRELGDDRRWAWCRRKLATWYLFQGDWKTAQPILEECVEVLEELEDDYELAQAANSLGWCYSLAGQWDKALEKRQAAFQLVMDRIAAQGFSDDYSLERCHLYMSDDLRRLRRLEEAEEHLLAALAISESLDERYERGRIYLCLSKVYRHKGPEFQAQAFECAERSIAFHEEQGSKMRLAQSLNQMGLCFQDRGQFVAAKSRFMEVAYLCRTEGREIPYYEAAALVKLARLCCLMGEFNDEFVALTSRAEELCQRHGFRHHMARLRVGTTEHALLTDQLETAAKFVVEAYAEAYAYNHYLAEEVHVELVKMLRPPSGVMDVLRLRRFADLLLKQMDAVFRADDGWCRRLDHQDRVRLSQQVRDLRAIREALQSTVVRWNPPNNRV